MGAQSWKVNADVQRENPQHERLRSDLHSLEVRQKEGGVDFGPGDSHTVPAVEPSDPWPVLSKRIDTRTERMDLQSPSQNMREQQTAFDHKSIFF